MCECKKHLNLLMHLHGKCIHLNTYATKMLRVYCIYKHILYIQTYILHGNIKDRESKRANERGKQNIHVHQTQFVLLTIHLAYMTSSEELCRPHILTTSAHSLTLSLLFVCSFVHLDSTQPCSVHSKLINVWFRTKCVFLFDDYFYQFYRQNALIRSYLASFCLSFNRIVHQYIHKQASTACRGKDNNL